MPAGTQWKRHSPTGAAAKQRGWNGAQRAPSGAGYEHALVSNLHLRDYGKTHE